MWHFKAKSSSLTLCISLYTTQIQISHFGVGRFDLNQSSIKVTTWLESGIKPDNSCPHPVPWLMAGVTYFKSQRYSWKQPFLSWHPVSEYQAHCNHSQWGWNWISLKLFLKITLPVPNCTSLNPTWTLPGPYLHRSYLHLTWTSHALVPVPSLVPASESSI